MPKARCAPGCTVVHITPAHGLGANGTGMGSAARGAAGGSGPGTPAKTLPYASTQAVPSIKNSGITVVKELCSPYVGRDDMSYTRRLTVLFLSVFLQRVLLVWAVLRQEIFRNSFCKSINGVC